MVYQIEVKLNSKISNLLPVHLTTHRLSYRLLKLSDAKIWDHFIKDRASQEFLKLDPKNQRASESWIENQHRRYNNGLGGLMAIELRKEKTFIGQAGLLIQSINDIEHIEVGYHILPEFRKNGYASEAALVLMNYVFDNNLSDHIISLIHIKNIASQNVAKKNRLKQTEQITYYGFPVYVYRIDKHS